MSVHPIVKQIINRDCHVSWPLKKVCKHVILKLKGGHASFRELPKEHRRRLLEDCSICHRKNVLLYQDVMQGRLGTRKETLPPIAELALAGSLSGNEICRLMRKYKVTIKGLSTLTAITQKRIREIRRVGLTDPHTIRDWLQAITGSDPGEVPEKFRISGPSEETSCNYCGCPVFWGESAYLYVNTVFCSRTCIRASIAAHSQSAS